MWAFRRTFVHLRNQGLSSGTSRISCVKPEIASFCLENHNAESIESQGKVWDALVYLRRFYSTSASTTQADTKSSRDHDDTLEDAIPALDTTNGAVHKDDELISELDHCEDESVVGDIQTELESIDSETDFGEKISPETDVVSAMTKALSDDPSLPVGVTTMTYSSKTQQIPK